MTSRPRDEIAASVPEVAPNWEVAYRAACAALRQYRRGIEALLPQAEPEVLTDLEILSRLHAELSRLREDALTADEMDTVLTFMGRDNRWALEERRPELFAKCERIAARISTQESPK